MAQPITTILYDDIKPTDNVRGRRFSAHPDDSGPWFDVFAWDPCTGRGFCRSEQWGFVLEFRITGRTVQRNMVRVQFRGATDLGDMAGTLRFDEPEFGGAVNEWFFYDMRRQAESDAWQAEAEA